MTLTIDKILKVEDLASLSTEMLIEAVKNGYKVEEISPHIKLVDTPTSWVPLTDDELNTLRVANLESDRYFDNRFDRRIGRGKSGYEFAGTPNTKHNE